MQLNTATYCDNKIHAYPQHILVISSTTNPSISPICCSTKRGHYYFDISHNGFQAWAIFSGLAQVSIEALKIIGYREIYDGIMIYPLYQTPTAFVGECFMSSDARREQLQSHGRKIFDIIPTFSEQLWKYLINNVDLWLCYILYNSWFADNISWIYIYFETRTKEQYIDIQKSTLHKIPWKLRSGWTLKWSEQNKN